MRPVSVIIATSRRRRQLELSLASYRHQRDVEFEIIVVDDAREPEVRELVEVYRNELDVRYLPVPADHDLGRAAARNHGARAADGDRLVFPSDETILGPGALAALAAAEDDEVVLPRRAAFVSTWGPMLPGATAARLLPLFRARPELGGLLAKEGRAEPMALVDASALNGNFDDVVARHTVNDALWERLAPAVARHGPALEGFGLGWLFGLAGCVSVERRAMFRVGLYHEAGREWDYEDPDLPYRLARRGLRFRVADEVQALHQLRAFQSWPFCAFRSIERFMTEHDSVAAWMLLRFLGNEDLVALGDVVAALEQGAGGAVDASLRRAARELVPLLLDELRVWWRRWLS